MKSLIILVLALYNLCEGSHILAFFPFPGKSHHAVFTPIIQRLCQNGHNVTFVTPFLFEELPDNCDQLKITNFQMDIPKFIEMNESYGANMANQQWMSLWNAVYLRQIGLGLSELILKDTTVRELISSDRQFDLILLETTFFLETFIAFHHRFNAPVVEISPPSNYHWTYSLYGNPYDTTYIVDSFNSFTDDMSFQERFINTISSFGIRLLYTFYYMPKTQALMDRYFRYTGWEGRPPLMDMLKNSSLLLMNTHVALNYPYPLSPNVKEIGGVHLQSEIKPLPKNIKEFIEGASNGVIYFTFGSHIQVSSTLGESLKKEFLKAFSKIKERVLWKWEKDFLDLPSNIMISKWFPQQDILAHKNVKLFISHGGTLSITEAIYNGVPVFGVPILGDQPKNVRHINHFGYGIGLDFKNLTEESILWAIRTTIDDPKYKQKCMELSSLFQDNPIKPLDKAAFWIDYVIRHKGAYHLRPAVTRLAWFQQVMLDIYLVLFLISIIVFLFFCGLVKLFIMCFQAKWSSSNRGKRKVKFN